MFARRSAEIGAGLLSVMFLLPRPAAADWPADPLVNVPLCTAAGDQGVPAAVPDGAGGAIVAWPDARGGAANADIHVQRVDAAGAPRWIADGVALCTAPGIQGPLAMVSDGAGGAIVAWQDARGGTGTDIYAQRVDATGAPRWTTDGVALCTAVGIQGPLAIVADGAGGAIVAWADARGGAGFDVYAQAVTAAGAPRWAPNGVALCTAAGDQNAPVIVADGADPGGTGSGAIVSWQDNRNFTTGYDIYARRVDAAGVAQWSADGVVVCAAAGKQDSPAIVPDGAGGADIAWTDQRSTSADIYAQRVDASGGPQWAADGVALCAAAGSQGFVALVSDSAGGAIAVWQDGRSGYDVYAQRVSAAGAVLWAAGGVAVCVATGWQYSPAIVADGAGGAIVAWEDGRVTFFDIYAQRLGADGAPQWASDGVALCTSAGSQVSPAIVADGGSPTAGGFGAIVLWQDNRNGSYDVYAQRVRANGLPGGLVEVPRADVVAFSLAPVRPNPARGGALTVDFSLASPAAASLELLDVAGRRVAVRDVGALGAGRHAVRLGEDRHLPPGIYLVCLRQGTGVRVTRAIVLP